MPSQASVPGCLVHLYESHMKVRCARSAIDFTLQRAVSSVMPSRQTLPVFRRPNLLLPKQSCSAVGQTLDYQKKALVNSSREERSQSFRSYHNYIYTRRWHFFTEMYNECSSA